MSEKFNINQVTLKAQEFITSKLEKPANFMNTHPSIRIGSAVAGTGVAIFATGAIGGSVLNEIIPNAFKLNMNPEQICEVGKSWEGKRKDSQKKFDDIQAEKAKTTKVPEKGGFITKPKDPKSVTPEKEYSVVGTVSSSKLQSIFKDGLGFNMQDQNSMLAFTNQFRKLLIEVDPEQILSNKQQQDLYSWFLRERIVSTTDMTPKRPSDDSIKDKATLKQYEAEYNKDRNLRIQFDRANKEAAKKKKRIPHPLNEIPPVYSPNFDQGKLDQIWYNDHKNIVTEYVSTTDESEYNTFVSSLNTKIEDLRNQRIEKIAKNDCKNDTKIITIGVKSNENIESVGSFISEEAEGRKTFKFGKKARNVEVNIKDYPIEVNEQIGRNLINLTSLVRPNRDITEARLSRILTSLRPVVVEVEGKTLEQATKDKAFKTQQLTQELVEIRRDMELEKKSIIDSEWQKMYTKLAALAGGIGVGGLGIYSMYLLRKMKNGEEGKVLDTVHKSEIQRIEEEKEELRRIKISDNQTIDVGEFRDPDKMNLDTANSWLQFLKDKNPELYNRVIKDQINSNPGELGGIAFYTHDDFVYYLETLPQLLLSFEKLPMKDKIEKQMEAIHIFLDDLEGKVKLIVTSYAINIHKFEYDNLRRLLEDQDNVLNNFIPQLRIILNDFVESSSSAKDRIQLKNIRDKTNKNLLSLCDSIPHEEGITTYQDPKIKKEEILIVAEAFDQLYKEKKSKQNIPIKSEDFENWYYLQLDSNYLHYRAVDLYKQTKPELTIADISGNPLREFQISEIEKELIARNENFVQKFIALDILRKSNLNDEIRVKVDQEIQLGLLKLNGKKEILEEVEKRLELEFIPIFPKLMSKYYVSLYQKTVLESVSELNMKDHVLGNFMLVSLLESGNIQRIVQDIDIQENVPISFSDVWVQSIPRLPSVNETAGNIKNTLAGIKNINPKEAIKEAGNKIKEGTSIAAETTSGFFEDRLENITKITERGIQGNIQEAAIIWSRWTREARESFASQERHSDDTINERLITVTSDLKKSNLKINPSKINLTEYVIDYKDKIINPLLEVAQYLEDFGVSTSDTLDTIASLYQQIHSTQDKNEELKLILQYEEACKPLENNYELLSNLVKLEQISILEAGNKTPTLDFTFKIAFVKIKETTQQNIKTLKGIFTNFTKNY